MILEDERCAAVAEQFLSRDVEEFDADAQVDLRSGLVGIGIAREPKIMSGVFQLEHAQF